jgi:hypothetical protein
MRPLAGLGLAALVACGVPADSQAETPSVQPANASEPKGTYAPRDDCGELDGAHAFRTALAAAVEARDAEALVALADPDIKLDFGGGQGTAELRKRLADPDYRLWDELEQVLPLGCAANSQDVFTLPWYFAQDFGELDSFSGMIVMGEDVPLRAAPRGDAEVLERISWDAVELQGYLGDEDAFVLVADDRGREGYIARANLRSLIDYRLIAERAAGKWAITAFVAGD